MTVRFLKFTALLASISQLGLGSVTLDDGLIDLSLLAADICAALQLETNPSVPGANIYYDEPDAALFVREGNDYCIAAFRGTTPTVADWFQNLDPFSSSVCSPVGDCCTTRNGFQRAYNMPDYKTYLEEDVRNCKLDCPECKVVMTGHSQGAAVAAVAAVAMSDLKPTIIAFGQPGSIVGSCPSINVNTYYRFVNTVVDSQGDLDYDPVPYLNFNADHMGHLFIMGDDNQNVVYYGNGRGPSIVSFGWQFRAHMMNRYVDRFINFASNLGTLGTLGTEGWDVGFACSVDEECISPNRCVDRRCHRGLVGDPCNRDNDCDSGRCEGWATYVLSGTCEQQLNNGESCNEDSDCLSINCPWGFNRKCS